MLHGHRDCAASGGSFCLPGPRSFTIYFSMGKKYVLSIISLTFGYMSIVFALPARAESTPQTRAGVILSEINWGGSGISTADEWFEIANVTGSPVNVSGWIVTGVATGGGAINFADENVIPANGTLLLANYTLGNQSTLAVTPDLITTAISIPNTKLKIALLMPDGTIVDEYIDAGTPDFGSSSTPFASMERDLDTLLWHTATQSMNLVDSTQLGSPSAISLVRDDLVPSLEPSLEDAPIAELNLEQTEPATSPEPVEMTDAPSEAVVAHINATDVSGSIDTPLPATEPAIIDVSSTEMPTVNTEVDETAAIEAVIETVSGIADPKESIVAVDFTIDDIHVEVPAANVTPDAVVNEVVEPIVTAITAIEAAAPVSHPDPVVDVANLEPDRSADTIARTGSIRLNEFVVTGDEWVELYNADTHAISLSGWTIRDATKKATLLGDVVLEAGAYLVVEKPIGKLNNDGDTIELVNAAGIVTDRVQYGTENLRPPKEVQSAAFGAEGWTLVDAPTKNAENSKSEASPTSEIIDTVYANNTLLEVTSDNTTHGAVASTATHAASLHASPATTTVVATATKVAVKATTAKKVLAASTKKVPKKKSTAVRDVTTIVDVADGTQVRFTAIVIALPGSFGDRVAYLSGAQLYMNTADWPALALGDMVTVVGEISTANGEKRIKLSGNTAITVGEQGVINAPQVVTLANDRIGTLVRIEGSVSARNGDTLIVRVGDTEIAVVSHDATGIHWSSLTATSVTITGIVRVKNGELVLMPRSIDDVTEEQPTPAVISAAAPISGFPVRPVAGSAAVLGTLSTLGYWLVRSRTLIPRLQS